MTDPKPLSSIDTFLASSVHDMKNSISILIGGLEKTLLQVNPALFPAGVDMAHMIYETKRINNNLIQLLTLYKTGHDLYPFDPQSQAVADMLRLISEQNLSLMASRNIGVEFVDAMRGVDFVGGSTGLGLHFSVVAAKMHRNRGRAGEIRLENSGSLGGGCFILRLP